LSFLLAKGKAKMDKQEKQVTTTGNGQQKPILADDKENMAEQSQPSQNSTSIAGGSTKPLSIREALSILQTLCFDLRALKCKTAILARDGALFIRITPPASIGSVGLSNGHITLDAVPVSKGAK